MPVVQRGDDLAVRSLVPARREEASGEQRLGREEALGLGTRWEGEGRVGVEGRVEEDPGEAEGFRVRGRLDEAREPRLETCWREGRDGRPRARRRRAVVVLGVLDEVVLAREVLVEELEAAEGVARPQVEDGA